MRLKIGLERPGGTVDDLALTLDGTATVGDVAAALVRADPGTPGVADSKVRGGTLRRHVDGAPPVVLPPDLTVLEAGLRSGARVSLADPPERFAAAAGGGGAAAVLRVVAGPNVGKTFELGWGSTQIGRDHDCDVRLHDPLVSKRHARLNVGEAVEVLDLNSSNGVQVGSGLVARAVVGPEDTVVLGGTALTVTLLPRAPGGIPTGPHVEVNRSPRLLPRVAEDEVVAPEPPRRPQRQRLPFLALLAPLVVGSVLYAVTRSTLTLLFVGLSPLLMLSSVVDTRRSAGRALREEVAGFHAAVEATRQELTERAGAEVAGRLREMPSTAEAVEAAYRLAPTLWSRRPDRPGFLALRLGVGRQPSRTTVQLPTSNATSPEHWRTLQALQADFAEVDGVPVLADLRAVGTFGVAGPAQAAGPVVRGLLTQLIALHSPAEVVVAGVGSTSSAPAWDWLKWLPHTGSAHSPLAGEHLAADPAAVLALVSELEQLVADRTPDKASADDPGPLPAVVLVVEDDTPIERSRLVGLAERGGPAGVHLLWTAASVARLPAACTAYLDVTLDGSTTAGYVETGISVRPLVCETVAPDVAEAVARRLAPLNDTGARVEDASDLPGSVSFLALTGSDIAEDAGAVLERWRENGSLPTPGVPRRRHEATLRALVGQTATGPFTLDLRTQGPHALVGGTTGAGKSEFLQSWILGMATTYSPQRVSFLFVDYKGGTAFADCVRLPHCVGLVTDLSPHLVRRALTSLRAELRHREYILNRKKAKDLISLERKGDPDTPPTLVIVVDEFAALVHEVPEFVDGVVDVAQRGRSLGLHLVLATQRPAGVIKDNLRANTNLRVALRMADADDSTDVLGVPIAADFDPGTPGRGAVRTGPGRVQPFQSAYVGGWTSAVLPPPRIDIADLSFGSGRAWEVPETEEQSPREPGPTDIARTVDAVRRAADSAGVPAPRRPWQDELEPVQEWALLTQRTDAALVLGVVDLPTEQRQEQFAYRPDEDGSLAVFGTGGSGKSTVLRTLAHAAALSPRGGPCQVYGLDFGAGGLAMLDELPHVGAIINGEDTERTARILGRLKAALEDRAVRYAAVRAATIAEYRALAQAPDEPRLLLLVDGLAAFRAEYEFTGRAAWWAAFQQIVTDGRQLGIHVVVTADRPGSLPSSLGASIQRRLVLRLADPADYALLDVSDDVLRLGSPPGRGIWDGDEAQVAVLGGSSNLATQARASQEFAASVVRQGVNAAEPVERLAERIPLSTLPVRRGVALIGVSDDDLLPVGIEPGGVFLVAGPPGSGRSTALLAIASSLRLGEPGTALHYLGQRRSPLAALGIWTSKAVIPDAVEELAAKLAAGLAGPSASGPVCVVLEGVSDFLNGRAELALQELVSVCRSNDHFLLAESETSTLGSSWPLLAAIKADRRGIALQPDQADGDTVFRTTFPKSRRAEYPPGRGLLVSGGKTRRVQLVLPE